MLTILTDSTSAISVVRKLDQGLAPFFFLIQDSRAGYTDGEAKDSPHHALRLRLGY